MSFENDEDCKEQLFFPASLGNSSCRVFSSSAFVYVPFLPFRSTSAQFLCWFLLNSVSNGASSLWEGSVGKGGRDDLRETTASIWVCRLKLFYHISFFLCCGSTAQCLTPSGQCGPCKASREAVTGSQGSKPKIFG